VAELLSFLFEEVGCVTRISSFVYFFIVLFKVTPLDSISIVDIGFVFDVSLAFFRRNSLSHFLVAELL
jgi:hypothetical protein